MKLSRDLLDEPTIHERLETLPGWTLANGRLHKRFTFANFVDAFGFMTKVAFEAETLNHHPNWSNVYSNVEVDLWTHDAKGVTELDLELATRMNHHAGG
jgi:4a-hydroxytetrahydrobiopterin dehydratase